MWRFGGRTLRDITSFWSDHWSEPSLASTFADPKFHECLARGGSRFEAFKQHESRLRTAAYQDFYGLDPSRVSRSETTSNDVARGYASTARHVQDSIPGGSRVRSYERRACQCSVRGAFSKPHRRKGEGCHRPRRRRLRSRPRRRGP